MRDGLSRLAPQVETHLFPAWDCLPFDRLSPQGALVGQRVETLARLAEGGAGSGAGAVLLTTVNAVLQRVPPQSYFSERSLVLAAGDSTGPARLCDFLVGQGYLRTDTVRETGEFALRGGILDIYPPDAARRCGLISLATSLRPFAISMRRRSEAAARKTGWCFGR